MPRETKDQRLLREQAEEMELLYQEQQKWPQRVMTVLESADRHGAIFSFQAGWFSINLNGETFQFPFVAPSGDYADTESRRGRDNLTSLEYALQMQDIKIAERKRKEDLARNGRMKLTDEEWQALFETRFESHHD